MQILFWVSVALVLYTYAGYPLILLMAASFRQFLADLRFAMSRGDRRQHASAVEPSVSIVFSAHNEAAVIAAKMHNCAALDYPPEKIEILAGCDGCSDATAELARAASSPNARIVEFAQRSGKAGALNRLMQLASGEIAIFSDANSLLAPDAVRLLARHFADPRKGCVSGELKLLATDGSPQAEGAYWRYEVFLKFLESRLNWLVGVNGGIFAIRRELFTPLPENGVVDDFLTAMRIRAAGYRIVYDPEACAYEETGRSVGHEFSRRVRIGAGNLQAVRSTARLLNPAAGGIAFAYWSHKILRWLVPLALLAAFGSAVCLASRPFYAVCAALGLLMAGLAIAGYRLELRNVRRGVFSAPYYFLSMNLALLLGYVRFFRRRTSATWAPTARENS